MPENRRQCARLRRVLEQAKFAIESQKWTEDQYRIVVVDALDVTLGVPGRHELLHRLQQSVVIVIFRSLWRLDGAIIDRRQHQIR